MWSLRTEEVIEITNESENFKTRKILSRHSETVTITPKDARWVGAWWMGFLVSSGLLLVSSVPFWFLPRSLPRQEGGEARREKLEGTEDALTNNHNLKLTDIAKGGDNPLPQIYAQIWF